MDPREALAKGLLVEGREPRANTFPGELPPVIKGQMELFDRED